MLIHLEMSPSSLVIFPILLPILIHAIEPEWTLPNCDPQEFYKPYVRVSLTRNGYHLKTLYTTGFIDIRPYSGVICINGPAVLYSTDDFSAGEPIIFFHGCLTFNRRDKDAYTSGDNQSAVVGRNNFTGVFFLSAPEDYRRSAFFFFPRPFYQIPIEIYGSLPRGGLVIFEGVSFHSSAVHDSSFAMVTNDGGMWGLEEIEIPPKPPSHCFNLSQYEELQIGVVEATRTAGMSPMYCFREEGEETAFDDIFNQSSQNLLTDMFDWWGCGDIGGGGGGGLIPDPALPTQLPDFRMVDPNTMKYPSNGQWLKQRWINAVGFYAPPPSSEQPTSTTPSSPPTVTLTDCEEVIPVPDCDATINGDEASRLLSHVLNQEKIDWSKPQIVAGSWRKKVMDQFVKIYHKICPQVSPALPKAIVKIMAIFINDVANNPETKQENSASKVGAKKWDIINKVDAIVVWKNFIAELENCNNNATKLPLYRTKDPNSRKRKKELEKQLEQLAFHPESSPYSRAQLDEAIKEVRVMAPYQIWLPPPNSRGNGTKIRLGRHIEAAEVDYDLDWIIDSFWRIFSTVAGYCIPYLSDFPNNKVFEALQESFNADFLDLVMEQWTQFEPFLDESGKVDPSGRTYILGNFHPIYEHLFGEYINGLSSRYMDACNDGSYWQSWAPHWRLPRHIYLKEGSPSTPTDNRTLNFFIAHPLMINYDPDFYSS